MLRKEPRTFRDEGNNEGAVNSYISFVIFPLVTSVMNKEREQVKEFMATGNCLKHTLFSGLQLSDVAGNYFV